MREKEGQVMETKKWKNKNLIEAFKHSLEGLNDTFWRERSLQIEIVCAVIAVLLGVYFKLTNFEWIILCLTVGIVLFAELMNTAIEIVLDLYSETYNEKIKRGKDVASSAVLIICIMAVIIGGIVFLPKLGMK